MKKTFFQLVRYAVVGLASNLFGYLLYLGLTFLGVGPKLSMSLLYAIGVAQTFFFNKRWTFRHQGSGRGAMLRYCAAYGLGYLINLAVLMVLVDQWHWPHQWVQGVMILALAVMLFLLQKFWVFRPSKLLTQA